MRLREKCRRENCRRVLHDVEIARADRSKDSGIVSPRISMNALKESRSWKKWLVDNGQEDAGWNWATLVAQSRRDQKRSHGWYEYSALRKGSRLLALMILEARRHGSRKTGRSVIYVEYLAVAPICRSAHPNREYRYCGEAMVQFAIHRSKRLGYRGAVALHSLGRARGFYSHIGFHDYGGDPMEGGLHYFEQHP